MGSACYAVVLVAVVVVVVVVVDVVVLVIVSSCFLSFSVGAVAVILGR